MTEYVLQNPLPIDIKQVLQILAAGGGTFVIGMLFSLIARKNAWYASLESDDKSLIMMAANIVLGLVSTVVLIYDGVIVYDDGTLIGRIAPFYMSFILCSLPYIGSQVMYALNKKEPQRPELEISGTVKGNVNVSKPQVPVQTKTQTTVETTVEDNNEGDEDDGSG